MENEFIFLTVFTIWYLINYKPTYTVFLFFIKLYYSLKQFSYYFINIIFLKCCADNSLNIVNDEISLILPKYEDKYLNEIINLTKTPVDMNKLNNCFVIEYTPLGNVLMMYDSCCESFKYYSDNAIPYRYLETVARKFVKMFNCKIIFIDMQEELQLAQLKWDIQQQQVLIHNQLPIQNNKSIFTKFKNYNKVNLPSTSHNNIQHNIPSSSTSSNNIQHNIQSKQLIISTTDTDSKIVKDKSNRFTYAGKMCNFSFLKKTDRKTVDKKYAMTFSDFKNLKN
jgi:hypothetical protein